MTDKHNILIVEDEKIIALDLQKRLEKYGYNILGTASTGAEAIEKTRELKPSIILMDIMLNGPLDGIDAAIEINQDNDIPIIFLTAYADEKTLLRAKEAQPVGYVLKPFKEQELCTTIEIAIYKHTVDMKLKIKERWFSSILHSVEDGIIATDINKKIQFINPSAERMLEFQESEIFNQPFETMFQIRIEAGGFLTIPDLSRSFEPFVFKDGSFRTKSGNFITLEGTVAPVFDNDEQISGVVLSIRDTSLMKEMSEQINYQANHDKLTGLFNRDSFTARMQNWLEESQSFKEEHSFLFMDMDNFKIINDTCGHDAGDELLKQLTVILRSVVRNSDVLGRLGGDEFGILLKGADTETASTIARRLHEKIIKHRFIWGKNSFNIQTSMGLISINEKSNDINTILAAADDACDLAKEEGGNRIKIYETGDETFVRRKDEMQWISRLTDAIDNNRFRLYYQPICALQPAKKNHIHGEILIRLQNSDGTVTMPAKFIPAAEHYKIMHKIDRWVIKNTISAFAKFQNQKANILSNLSVSVNLSGASLEEDDLAEYIKEIFDEYKTPPEIFCFEVTETSALSNKDKAVEFMNELKKMGCRFALDDFGSGFSSFAYLKSLPVDYLKIDGSFVKDIHKDPISNAMVVAINNLGHVLGIETIAEFVSSSEIERQLIEIGVDFGQGFHLGKPEPISEMPLLKGKS